MIQKMYGVVLFFFGSEFYICSSFIEFGQSFLYNCFILVVDQENILDISKIYPIIWYFIKKDIC
jgi:hypothetical protein